MAVCNDQIGVPVELKERGNFSHTFVDGPMKHDPALGCEITGKENIRTPKGDRKEKPSQERIDGNPTISLIGRIDIPVTLWVVKLFFLGPDNDIIACLLSVIDLRSLDSDASGHRGEILDH